MTKKEIKTMFNSAVLDWTYSLNKTVSKETDNAVKDVKMYFMKRLNSGNKKEKPNKLTQSINNDKKKPCKACNNEVGEPCRECKHFKVLSGLPVCTKSKGKG